MVYPAGDRVAAITGTVVRPATTGGEGMEQHRQGTYAPKERTVPIRSITKLARRVTFTASHGSPVEEAVAIILVGSRPDGCGGGLGLSVTPDHDAFDLVGDPEICQRVHRTVDVGVVRRRRFPNASKGPGVSWPSSTDRGGAAGEVDGPAPIKPQRTAALWRDAGVRLIAVSGGS